MFWTALLTALFVAVVLTFAYGVFVSLARREGPEGPTAVGAAALMVFFFALVFLAAWAGGIWLSAVSPAIGVPFWSGFVLVAVVVALLLAAAGPQEPTRGPEPTGERPGEGGVSAFFWGLFLLFVVAIAVFYIVNGDVSLPVERAAPGLGLPRLP